MNILGFQDNKTSNSLLLLLDSEDLYYRLGKQLGFTRDIRSCTYTIIYSNFIFLKTRKGNFTSFLTKAFLGTYADQLEFTVSPVVI